MSLAPLKDGDKPSFDGQIHACPLRGYLTSFQLTRLVRCRLAGRSPV